MRHIATAARALAIGAAILTALSVLAACSHSSGSDTAAARAKASALATSPEVLHAETKLAPKVSNCGDQNGVALHVTGAGTPGMKVSVGHVNGTVMLHPVHTIESVAQCLGLTGAKLDALKAYAKGVIQSNGFGKGSGTKDFTQIINYIAQQQATS